MYDFEEREREGGVRGKKSKRGFSSFILLFLKLLKKSYYIYILYST